MNTKQIFATDQAHHLLAPRLAYLLTTRWAHEAAAIDIAPISNVTSVSNSPQRVAVAVFNEWQTLSNIRAYSEFVINVPPAQLLQAVWITGHRYSNIPVPDTKNKAAAAGVTLFPSVRLQTPSILECYGHLECTVTQELDVGDHTLFIADVICARASEGALDSTFVADVETLRPVLQNSGRRFCFPGNQVMVNDVEVIEEMHNRTLGQ